MGETKGCKIEIVKIAEDTPRFLEAKGVTIATFLSVAEPGEITEYFKTFNRNFMVFDLNKNSSGFNLTNKQIQELLFGHLDNEDNGSIEFKNKTNDLIDDINRQSRANAANRINKPKKTKINLESRIIKPKTRYIISEDMTKSEITEIINQILDKGTDNLTKYDRETLAKLSELSAQTK
jgi:hypothetical protein